MPDHSPAYRRVLLKLSGEALMGEGEFGIDPETMRGFAGEIRDAVAMGVQVGLVIGGGNLFRGVSLSAGGMKRASADYMGMLATVMNSLAMQDALEQMAVPTEVMSALGIHPVCEEFDRRRAIRHLEQGRVVIFAAGTGNPFFTTDSAASLRAIEIEAQLMLKATKVDGVYSADPVKDPGAERYDRLSYDEVIERKLNVMDATAVILCRDHDLPMRVFNIFNEGDFLRLIRGEDVGTLVQKEKKNDQ